MKNSSIEDTEQTAKKTRRPNIPFWVTVARAVLATLLGLALLIKPDTARPNLVNFMGMFWLASGIMALRWGARGRPAKQKLPIAAGFLGIMAGVLALSRNIVSGQLSEGLIMNILGGVMILTGLAHVMGGFRLGRQARHQTWASSLLGIFEVILGAIAILAQSPEFFDTVFWLFTLWALVGGFMLFTDALAMRRRAKQS